MLRLTVCLLWFSSSVAFAQVATDGSVGAALVLSGQSVVITETLGARRGDNLFHSFQEFNVNSGQTVTFTGDAQISNVISRVTGGNTSEILGVLRSEVETSNFFLVNPAGVMIGDGAEIDMPGAFHVSDADRLIFADGAVLETGAALGDGLSFAAPEAFGFLSSDGGVSLQNAVIGGDIDGNFEIIAGSVEVSDSSLALSGGDLRIEGVGIGRATLTDLTAESAGGRVTISDTVVTVDAGGRATIRGGEIQASGLNLELNDLGTSNAAGAGGLTLSGSAITLSDSNVDVFSFGGGANGLLSVEGGAIQLVRSSLGSSTSGFSTGGNVSVTADSLMMTESSFISAGTFSEANSGDVSIETGTLTISGGGIINNSLAEGDAGSIIISSSNIEITEATVNSETFAVGPGFGGSGDIAIFADDLTLTLSSITNSNETDSRSGSINLVIANSFLVDAGTVASESTGGADSGFITITAGDMTVRDGGLISSSVFSPGLNVFENADGAAGQILITADSLVMDAGFNERTAIETRSFSDGAAGTIQIQSDQVSLDGLANINSSTDGAGEGGLVRVDANTILLTNGAKILSSTSGQGNAGGVGLFFDELSVRSSPFETSRVSSDSDGDGDGGLVALSGRLIEVSDRGLISVDNTGAGAGGALIISSETLKMSSNGALTAITQGAGAGGFIAIDSAAIEMDTGLISSTTRGAGLGGGVDIQAGRIDLVNSEILSDAENLGDGGDIIISADVITIAGEGGDISLIATDNLANAPDEPSGAAGRIGITATSLMLINGGAISSNTQGAGPAGSIAIQADSLMILTEAGEEESEITSETFGDGSGGLVTIDGRELTIVGSTITSSTSGAGDGGGLQITTDLLESRNGQILSDTDGTGDAGFITVEAGTVLLIGEDGEASLIASDNLADAPDQISGDAGNISITALNLGLFDGGRISSNTRGAGNAGSISVFADRVTISGDPDGPLTNISSDTDGDGFGGFIDVEMAELLVTGRARISADGRGAGDGGVIQLTFDQARIDNGATISTAAFAAGDAGAIGLLGRDLVMRGATLSSASNEGATGDAGAIFLDVGVARIVNSEISSDTAGTGSGGLVSVESDFLVVKGTGDDTASISAETGGDGDGGAIDLTVDRIRVVNGAITTNAKGAGEGGLIDIEAAILVVLAEDDFFGAISADSEGTGDGGRIRINSEALRVLDGGLISTDASGEGNAGDVRINSGVVAVRFGPVFASEIGSNSFGGGDGGQVRIRAKDVIISDGGRISSDSTATGAGGVVDLKSNRLIMIEGQITSEASGDGRGGDVLVNVKDARIVKKTGFDPSGVSTKSTDRPNEAGSIEFSARNLEVDGGQITTSSEVGSGGQVLVSARSQLRLSDGGIVTSVAQGGEDGGDIIVLGGLIILGEDGQILANADAGNGGDMDIIMKALFRTRGTDIRARSQLGIDGQIAIDGLQNPDTADVVGLPVDFLDANAVLDNPCLSALLDKSQLLLGGDTFVARMPGQSGASSLLAGQLEAGGGASPISSGAIISGSADFACGDAR